ncbi:hypothetical protein BGX34_006765, partial [Mortierella sp. NVP85]
MASSADDRKELEKRAALKLKAKAKRNRPPRPRSLAVYYSDKSYRSNTTVHNMDYATPSGNEIEELNHYTLQSMSDHHGIDKTGLPAQDSSIGTHGYRRIEATLRGPTSSGLQHHHSWIMQDRGNPQ